MSLRSFIIGILVTETALAVEVAAQSDSPPDSLLYRLHREVVVTASRFPVESSRTAAAVDLLDGELLDMLPGTTAADALRLVTGASMREYGAAGGLSLVSFRGLGPEYSVIFLNGVRLNDAQNGLVDLGRLSLQNVTRIESARGGYAALYGSDALGGVVDLRTGTSEAPIVIRTGGGSFGWRLFEGTVLESSGGHHAQISALYEDASNSFRFQLPDTHGEMIRRGANAVRRQVSADAATAIGSSTMRLTASASNSDVGTPGPVTSSSQGRARQKDMNMLLSLGWSMHPDRTSTVSCAPTVSYSAQRYFDPLLVTDGTALDSRYDNLGIAMSASYERVLAPNFRTFSGVEVLTASLRSVDVRGIPRRFQSAIFMTAEWSPSQHGPLTLYPAFRFDNIADSPNARTTRAWSPSIGAHLTVFNDILTIRGRIGTGFRIPTFNQLYWKQGGNPGLRPEYSIAYEGGTRIGTRDQHLTLDLSLFHHDLTDKIVWSPGAGMYWTPINMRHVISNGIESTVAGTLGGAVTWRATATWMRARKMDAAFVGDRTAGKILPYSPEIFGSALLEFMPWADMTVTVIEQVTGDRYTEETNDPAQRLPAFATTDIAATATISPAHLDVRLKAEILNMFNTSYQVIAWYPMPPRAVRLTLSLLIPHSRKRELQ